jgi:hypothetical protein
MGCGVALIIVSPALAALAIYGLTQVVLLIDPGAISLYGMEDYFERILQHVDFLATLPVLLALPVFLWQMRRYSAQGYEEQALDLAYRLRLFQSVLGVLIVAVSVLYLSLTAASLSPRAETDASIDAEIRMGNVVYWKWEDSRVHVPTPAETAPTLC